MYRLLKALFCLCLLLTAMPALAEDAPIDSDEGAVIDVDEPVDVPIESIPPVTLQYSDLREYRAWQWAGVSGLAIAGLSGGLLYGGTKNDNAGLLIAGAVGLLGVAPLTLAGCSYYAMTTLQGLGLEPRHQGGDVAIVGLALVGGGIVATISFPFLGMAAQTVGYVCAYFGSIAQLISNASEVAQMRRAGRIAGRLGLSDSALVLAAPFFVEGGSGMAVHVMF